MSNSLRSSDEIFKLQAKEKSHRWEKKQIMSLCPHVENKPNYVTLILNHSVSSLYEIIMEIVTNRNIKVLVKHLDLLCVARLWACLNTPAWTFNKSYIAGGKPLTDWLTADSFMTKLLLLHSEHSSLVKSMVRHHHLYYTTLYSVSVSPLIWSKSITSPQQYNTPALLIDSSYDSSCHVTPNSIWYAHYISEQFKLRLYRAYTCHF